MFTGSEKDRRIIGHIQAVELLALIAAHLGSSRYSRTRAERVLSMMRTEARRSQGDRTSARERGQALAPESAVALVKPIRIEADITPLKGHQRSLDSLSQRELEVLVLIAEGLTNQEISDRLYIGVSTVKKHINHIYSKLDVTHRAQAVARARALNILS
jgi:NarL family two-component system response regulator LiaR